MAAATFTAFYLSDVFHIKIKYFSIYYEDDTFVNNYNKALCLKHMFCKKLTVKLTF